MDEPHRFASYHSRSTPLNVRPYILTFNIYDLTCLKLTEANTETRVYRQVTGSYTVPGAAAGNDPAELRPPNNNCAPQREEKEADRQKCVRGRGGIGDRLHVS